jgi:hypothetical protein
MQDKLLLAWDFLQTPFATRFLFMEKLSTHAYSLEMSKVIDLYGEATVFVFVLKKLKSLHRNVQVIY